MVRNLCMLTIPHHVNQQLEWTNVGERGGVVWEYSLTVHNHSLKQHSFHSFLLSYGTYFRYVDKTAPRVSATGVDKEAAKQIFTSSAASGILTNDLVHIMEKDKVKVGARLNFVLKCIYNIVN